MRILVLVLILACIPLIESEGLDGTFYWKRLSVPTSNELDAKIAFEYFFDHGEHSVPKNVKVFDANLENGLLTVDVSGDIMSYEGSAFEYALTEQLIKLATEIPRAKRFTLLIGGIAQPLVSGTTILDYGL